MGLRDEWVPESTENHIQSSDVYRILKDILQLFFHEHPGLCAGYIAIILVQSIADNYEELKRAAPPCNYGMEDAVLGKHT